MHPPVAAAPLPGMRPDDAAAGRTRCHSAPEVEAQRQPTGALAAALALGLTLLAGCASSPEPWAPPAEAVRYDYPIDNPWLATNRRHAASRSGRPSRARRLGAPDRQPLSGAGKPEGFWYYRGLTYSLITQSHRAPLVFVIGATGADDRAPLMTTLGK
jgi:hypothetical protein